MVGGIGFYVVRPLPLLLLVLLGISHLFALNAFSLIQKQKKSSARMPIKLLIAMKFLKNIHEIYFDNIPTILKERNGKTIRTRVLSSFISLRTLCTSFSEKSPFQPHPIMG